MNQIVVIDIPQEKALEVFAGDKGLDPYIQQIEAEVTSFVPDISSKKGREAIASLAYKVARSKAVLDSVGKDLVSRLKEQPKLVDAERKRMRDYLDNLRDKVREPLTRWEDAEQERVDRHNLNIQELQQLAEIEHGLTAEHIRRSLKQAESFVVDDSLEEFQAKAAIAKDDTVSSIKERLEAQEKLEAEQAELERLRNEAAEREAKERDERIAREAEAKAKAEAEAAAKAEREAGERRELELRLAAETAKKERAEAIQKAEQAAKDAQERERQAVIDAEARAKREAEERAEQERQAQEKREANKRHRSKINNEAAASFEGTGFTKDQAKQIVTLIAQGEAKHISINY